MSRVVIEVEWAPNAPNDLPDYVLVPLDFDLTPAIMTKWLEDNFAKGHKIEEWHTKGG